jgi:MinD-like ATPase involved in chromosome partitioning or flagellar assembly
MKKTISIHSSRGGTGKTLIATNLAGILANKGLSVVLLDLDFGAPSLSTVFSKGVDLPVNYWLNDFLDGRCKPEQILVDVSEKYKLKGSLRLGLANPSMEAIRSIMEKSQSWEVTAVKRLFSLCSALSDKMGVDYCIFDTSPGIHYSSINAVVCSDTPLLVTTLDSLDLKGVKDAISEIYDAISKEPSIIINKVLSKTQNSSGEREEKLIRMVEQLLKHSVISVIPCYCDVLQTERTKLLAVEKPTHPFIKDLEEVVRKLDNAK